MKSFISTYRVATAALLLAAVTGLTSSCKDYLNVEPMTLSTTEATFSTVSGPPAPCSEPTIRFRATTATAPASTCTSPTTPTR
ncbi:hypothetical protein [Hymenobacter jejuensis]|uniref:hypothetical protein n=1 Tax=Hymenobacter jejuensis TaxID=2502781 RepID=UPI001E38DE89|nr:hypothetical protein [Hymenobacter jejuensis]